MKKLAVLMCVLLIMTSMIFVSCPGREAASVAFEEGPMYTPDFLINFRIDPAQIPAAKRNTTLHIGASIRSLDGAYYVSKRDGMRMFEAYLRSIGQAVQGHELLHGGTNAGQLDSIRAFAALAGSNGITYADPNEDAVAFVLADAMRAAGGFVGTAWNKPDDVGPIDLTPNWVIHTSPDNVAGAYRTARAMFEAMGGNGEIFVINGMMGNTAAVDRRAGLERALAAFPGIRIVREDTGNWQTPEALRLTETWLPLHPNVRGIWTANDNMALGAVQALQARGLAGRVFVVGFDGTAPVVEQIRDGNILATVSANGYLQSGFTLAILYAVWTRQLNPARFPANFREFATPAGFITSANAAEFLAGPPSFDFSRPFYFGRDN